MLRGAADLDFLTIKYDPDGIQLWARRYDGPAGGEDQVYALATDDLGNVYVTGCSWASGTSFDYTTIKFAPRPQVPVSSCLRHWVLVALLLALALRALQKKTSTVRYRA